MDVCILLYILNIQMWVTLSNTNGGNIGILVLKAMYDDYHAICKNNKMSSHKISGRY